MTNIVTLAPYRIESKDLSLNESLIYWNGGFSLVTHSIKTLSKITSQLAYSILFPLNLFFNNTQATASLLKKINRNILPIIEFLQNVPNRYAKLNTILTSSVAIIDSVQITLIIDYLVNRKFNYDTALIITGRIFHFIALLGECFFWLAKDGFIFENFAKTVGNSCFFSLKVLINSSFGIYHFLFAMDTYNQLHETQNLFKKQFQQIEIAKHTAELALASLTMIGNTLCYSYSLGITSIVCIGLELASLIYKDCHEKYL
jgi:hypothetical protein